MPRKPQITTEQAEPATPDDLTVLKAIADLTPEGRAVASSALQEAGIKASALRDLQAVGLIELVEEEGDPAVTITADGLATLNDQLSG